MDYIFAFFSRNNVNGWSLDGGGYSWQFTCSLMWVPINGIRGVLIGVEAFYRRLMYGKNYENLLTYVIN